MLKSAQNGLVVTIIPVVYHIASFGPWAQSPKAFGGVNLWSVIWNTCRNSHSRATLRVGVLGHQPWVVKTNESDSRNQNICVESGAEAGSTTPDTPFCVTPHSGTQCPTWYWWCLFVILLLFVWLHSMGTLFPCWANPPP